MKLESQITNNHSSLIDNQSKRRSTPVENVRQITPFYAKQSQFQKCKKNINLDIKGIYKYLYRSPGQKTKPKQTQFKANKAKNKPNSNPIYHSKRVPKQSPFAERTK